MRDAQKISRISISTKSTEPLSGIAEIATADSTVKFELNADIAHRICTELERFLTRGQKAGQGDV
jgi:hypothetical protein